MKIIDKKAMKQNEHIWISAEDLGGDEALVKESTREFFNLPVLNDLADEKTVSEHSANTNRRDFLKYLGFSLGAATFAAACETPIRKAIPYVSKPEAIVPGVATYYASSYVRGGEFCPVLVKTREGRPIKIEGNAMATSMGGGTTARAQASVLDLYDVARLRKPSMKDADGIVSDLGWSDLDAAIVKGLQAAKAIRIVTHTNLSPVFAASVDKFMATYPNAKLVTYDPISSSAALLAHESAFGVREMPGYRFDKASLVVNFGADFLGTWLNPAAFASQFAGRRKLKGSETANMSRLVQFESNMSYTGSNADHRVLIKPSEQGLAIAKLHNALAQKMNLPTIGINGSLSNPKAEKAISLVADELIQAKGTSIVVTNSNNTAEQALVVAINQSLGNYGTTLDMTHSSLQRKGIDQDMASFVKDLSSGAVDAVIFADDANPVYDHPLGAQIATALDNLSLSVTLTNMPSETQDLCRYTVATPHFLETWGDVNPQRGYYGVVQPVINPLFDTRPTAQSIATWAGQSDLAADGEDFMYAMVKQWWEKEVFPKQDKFATFRSFWDSTLSDGFVEVEVEPRDLSYALDVSTLEGKINRLANSELEVLFYEPMGIGNGSFANNPWLQEMPDPVTRAVWDNVLHIPLQWNGKDKFEYFKNLDEDGLLVDLTVGEQKVQLPVVRQFGQMQGTVAVALGYGRELSGKAGTGVGSNCYPMTTLDADGNIQYFSTEPIVSGKVGKDKKYASVQHHHTLGVTGTDSSANGATINVDEKTVMTLGTGFQGGLTKRSIFRHANANELAESIEHLKEERAEFQHLNQQTLYPDRSEFYGAGHHWGLSVDLTACIGCAACQVACVAENNVPIVGKEEVSRHHEMTWLRIDRYYYGDAESPNVVYQPMMCQHCDNAPCENVCPVAATNHSSEGLNQMAYNRCVGTRYCANNCPYKVRRFNWLDYNAADLFPSNENDPFDEATPYYADNLTRMVLNPDVTVRSRGVIEKCSMCVQRIQEGKLTAKSQNRRLKDGDIKTACQTACPTGAITFGDMNNQDSKLNELLEDPKTYIALEETNVRSSVGYMMKVLNKSEKINTQEA
jgi:molybdopterin-containing oxidoreductase family iron-sulfur binding subunit